MSENRTKNSILNAGSNFGILIMRTIMSFVVRTVFIKVLGEEYLGISSLFSNVLTVLSIAELGVGTAISFSLYEPLTRNDNYKVSTIMCFFKKIYNIVGIVITVLGLCLLPLIPSLVGKVTVSYGTVYAIYIMYLFNTVSMYFISYKETLILADQKNYLLTRINFWTFFIMFIGQIVALLVTKNFIIYFLIQIVMTLIQRIMNNIYITNNYKDIDFKNKDKLPSQELQKIKKNVFAMFCHRLGTNIINGTDNIIISSFVGVIAVGLYTNYFSLISMINSLLYSIFTAITSSFANLKVLGTKESQENVFNILNFGGFILFSYCTICFFCLANSFVQLWIGKSYVLSQDVLIVICLNFYIGGIRAPLETIKQASGVYTQDRIVPLIQAVVNLVVSIVLAMQFGLIGVLLGTTVSKVFLPCITEPYVSYKYIFNKKPYAYYYDYIVKVLLTTIMSAICYVALIYIRIPISFLGLIEGLIVITIIYCLIIVLLFFRNDNFKYYINLFKSKLKH